MLREAHVRLPVNGDWSLYLAEFVWRTKYLTRHSDDRHGKCKEAFWQLIAAIKETYPAPALDDGVQALTLSPEKTAAFEALKCADLPSVPRNPDRTLFQGEVSSAAPDPAASKTLPHGPFKGKTFGAVLRNQPEYCSTLLGVASCYPEQWADFFIFNTFIAYLKRSGVLPAPLRVPDAPLALAASSLSMVLPTNPNTHVIGFSGYRSLQFCHLT